MAAPINDGDIWLPPTLVEPYEDPEYDLIPTILGMTNPPIAWFKFDEDTGEIIGEDETGNSPTPEDNYHLTGDAAGFPGDTICDCGKSFRGLVPDSGAKNIFIADGIQLPTDRRNYSCVCFVEVFDRVRSAWFCSNGDLSLNHHQGSTFAIDTDGYVYVAVRTTTSYNSYISSQYIDLDTPTVIGVTLETTSADIYVNGVFKETLTFDSAQELTHTTAFAVAGLLKWYPVVDVYDKGGSAYYDEWMLFDGSLSSDDHALVYAALIKDCSVENNCTPHYEQLNVDGDPGEVQPGDLWIVEE